jgi:hypothetical protein
MKNSNPRAIQKKLNNGYKTVVSFGKRIQIQLSKKQIEKLEFDLACYRKQLPVYLWTSVQFVTKVVNNLPIQVKQAVQGTYCRALHGELKLN